ncbi:MAG: 5-formyltetrahydrofolate cyclo-ligase [Oscillospiraceae bacterium]|nr:5-formyltetrahydrofolate cyclo-ligase [Oscillospiraceae bacterium]
MARVDIRVVKNTLRAEFKQKRRQLPQHLKRQKDYSIFKLIVGLNEYKQCEILVCFVSTAIEVDTHKLIRHALDNGKAVAVPRCIDGTSLMQFYLINSLDDLEPGSFSVLEPIVDRCKKIDEFVHSVCIVPGLGFDMKGYRLGYGKGYYDTFL